MRLRQEDCLLEKVLSENVYSLSDVKCHSGILVRSAYATGSFRVKCPVGHVHPKMWTWHTKVTFSDRWTATAPYSNKCHVKIPHPSPLPEGEGEGMHDI